ncbi:unnamed protein product [Hyaloperonospora brassicae]|uniref:WIBG Mago-binding domain-containing protein n=1 Tax=Hyaloperonospora brassicae TaxID=162125 RepID=A0AAV0UC02_HYABA|nr:unnamed protein product [Hyaloperonospora brassicae]
MNAVTTTPSRLPSGAVRTTDGDVIVPATRRADGSLRKPIRIRKGYVPQEEVPKYKTIAQRRREQEAKKADDTATAVDELSMDTLSLAETSKAVGGKQRCRSSAERRDDGARGKDRQPQLPKDKGDVTMPVETSSECAGDAQQRLKQKLTGINRQLKEMEQQMDGKGRTLSRQEKQTVESKAALQQQRKEIIAELNGATVTTSTSGPRPKVSISL